MGMQREMSVSDVRAPERPARVVLVDDQLQVRDFLRAVLNASGCQVVGEAVDGEEAVRVISSLRPDVVVMDLEMPAMGGIEATKWVKWAAPEVRIVVFSAQDASICKEALASGASAFFRKDQLSDLVESVIDSY